MAGLALLRRERWKLRLPIPQDEGLDAREFADLSYLEEELVWNLGFYRARHSRRAPPRRIRCLIIIGVPVNGNF